MSASRTISATVVPALSCASLVEAPRCGVTTTLSNAKSGESVVGSFANTSSAAPPRCPLSIALASASSSTMPPRAVFTRRAPCFISRELVLAEQPLGLGGSRQMDRHEVGLDQERLERRHRIDAHLLRTLGADVGIERDHPHAEPGRALGHERPHPSQPDEADRLAGELDALPLRTLPRALFQRGVGLRGVASLRQEQGHRLFGGADDVGLRRVDHHDAAARGGFDVDVVQADPRARHHLQLWRGGEHLVGDLRGAADDERVVGRDLGREVAPGEVGAHVHLEVLAEQLQPLLGELLGDEDPHEARDSMKTVSAAATAAPRFTG